MIGQNKYVIVFYLFIIKPNNIAEYLLIIELDDRVK